ncbi:MAG: hypothetical protein H0W61_18050 [Bacteroidetes bacterium]|nr:hypothetical protein [Bacteroidota bacterium]
MKKVIILFVLFLCKENFIAQTSDQKVKRIELQKTYEPVQGKSLNSEESVYYGYDAKIKEILLKESSISLVPTRAGNQSKNDYLTVLNDWIKSNSLLIKPDHRGIKID